MTSLPSSLHPQGRHAIVIGGSMAGLLAAKVLTHHFDRVTIVEKDQLPQSPEFRKGVPQAHHAHVLLMRGQQILEQLFPGIGEDMKAAGVPLLDWTADCSWLMTTGWSPRFASALRSFSCSRIFLEGLVRQRLSQLHSVHFLDDCQVQGLLTNEDRSRVTGVTFSRRTPAQTEILNADLVVDASGRNSALPQWLTALAYEPPTESVVNSFLSYGTRWYEIPPEMQTGWKALLVSYKAPVNRRGGVLFPVEGDRWVLTVSSVGKDYIPTDEAAFLQFTHSLRSSVLYDVIQSARPLSPIYPYRRTENCWRHYEKLSRLPEGMVAVGDAVCAFNPFYGQGMTIAALGALTLDQALHQQSRLSRFRRRVSFSLSFQKQLAGQLQAPWLMATSEDFRWEMTEGETPGPSTRLMHRYMDYILKLSVDHPDVYQTFLEVIHMIKPSTALFSPRILTRLIQASLFQKQTLNLYNHPDIKPDLEPLISAQKSGQIQQ